jgi:hypothetical protein
MLYSTNNGEVTLSNCGNHYKIVYKNIVICQNQTEYYKLLKSVSDCNEFYSNEKNSEVKDIVFSTYDPSIFFIFSPLEIEELKFLMESSWIESQIYAKASL